ncbi:hypothetical protein D3C87_1325910 [compost metagenome]
MHRQIERAVVNRQEPLAAQVDMRLQGLFGLHVHKRPAFIVGAGLHQGQVEGAVRVAYRLEAVEVAAVSAEEHAQVGVLDDPRGPEAAVAVGQPAAGEVLGGGGGQAQAVDVGGLPPVQLFDLGGVYAPGDQLVADAQRRDEPAGLGVQFRDSGAVQVVVVVVRQDDARDRGQVFDADRRRVKARGAGPLHRRGACGEDGVRQPVAAAQLHEQGGMPEPVEAAVGRGVELCAVQGAHRDGDVRNGSGGLGEEEGPGELHAFPKAHGRARERVLKAPVPMLRRFRMAGQGGAVAEGEGGHDKDSKQDKDEQSEARSLHGADQKLHYTV